MFILSGANFFYDTFLFPVAFPYKNPFLACYAATNNDSISSHKNLNLLFVSLKSELCGEKGGKKTRKAISDEQNRFPTVTRASGALFSLSSFDVKPNTATCVLMALTFYAARNLRLCSAKEILT